MGNLSKQDIQSIIDNAKNRIVERAVSKQDLATITESVRDRLMNYMHDLVLAQQQQLMRQFGAQNTQMQRYVSFMENRMTTMEHELKALRQLMQRLAESSEAKPHLKMPMQPNQAEHAYSKYAYRPN